MNCSARRRLSAKLSALWEGERLTHTRSQGVRSLMLVSFQKGRKEREQKTEKGGRSLIQPSSPRGK